MVIEGFIVFIFTDTQTFTGSEFHKVTAVACDVVFIDQIRFMNAHKFAIFLMEARFYNVELLVKGVAPAGCDDVGASCLGGKISYFTDGDMEVLWSDIIGKGIRIVKNCLIGKGSISTQVFSALVGHDVDWFKQRVLGGRGVVAALCDDGDQLFINTLGFHHDAAHHTVLLLHVIEEDIGAVALNTALELIRIVVTHHRDRRITALEKALYLAFYEI